MSEMNDYPVERVSVSLAQLRAELTALELRLVDRLNLALEQKVDKGEFDRMASMCEASQERMSRIEQEMVSLHEVGKYKKWLWAQTIALVAIAIPVFTYVTEHLGRGG